MLQRLHDGLQGTIAKIVLVLITIPFALVGIDAFFGGGVPKVAVVGEETITQAELDQAIELQRRRLIAASEESVDPAELEEAKLRGPVLDSLIDRKLLGQVAKHSGFRVGDALIDRIILEDTSFQENGQFSQERFQGILASNGMNPGYYRNLLREEILINQVLGGIGTSDFSTSSEMQELARITQQSVDVRYLTVPLAEASAANAPSAERIKAYYDANPAEFRTEETVSLDYLELRLEDLFTEVAEADVEAEYQRRLEGFKAAEERQAAHIMISSLDDDPAKARLLEIRKRLDAGEDFAVLAKDLSEDVGSASNGGDLGYSAGDAFPAEFEEALRGLQPGQVSEPLKTDSGWHLVKLLDVRAQAAPTLAELRDEIVSDLQRRESKPRFVERSEHLADLTFNSEGLVEAAKELGLEVQQGPAISRRGGEGLFADARVIAAGFGREVLEDGQNSELIEISEEHVVVLRRREHSPERQQELAEVEPRIKGLLVEAIRREQAAARAEQLESTLASGTSVEELARKEGLQWQLALTHRRGASDLPEALSEAVFQHPRGEGAGPRGRVVLPSGEVVVFELANFREGELDAIPAEQQSMMRNLLAQSRGAAAVAHYRQRLRETIPVELL